MSGFDISALFLAMLAQECRAQFELSFEIPISSPISFRPLLRLLRKLSIDEYLFLTSERKPLNYIYQLVFEVQAQSL